LESKSGENIFYHHRFLIHKFDNANNKGIPPCQLAVPFSFKLDNYLPGTVDFQDPEIKAKIYYKIKAEIVSHKPKNVGNMKFTNKLILHQQHKEAFTQNSMLVTYKSFCCIDKGKTMIDFSIDKEQYTPKERVIFVADVDNSKSDVRVNNLFLNVYRTIQLRS